MSTTIPIQELDTSTNPPSDRSIHAVVTLLWPYSSSTRSCALLLSERDFRLRARGGQIRVKFSGPVARAVAERRLGIGDEVILELGSGEWVRDEVGAAVRVPGKSVGELQFGRGASLRVKRDGVDEVEIRVADDAVDEVEQEQEEVPIQATPVKRTSPVTNFRSSIRGPPGSAAIYSSPAYMRKAAKFSYLDGISRLFEDEWNNQDLPRKKARTSFGEVRAWKVVARTPSPEPEGPPSDANAQVDEEMAEADVAEDTDGEKALFDGTKVAEPDISQAPAVESQPVSPSPSPTPLPQEPTLVSPTKATSSHTNPLDLLAASALEDQETVSPQATNIASTLPKLRFPSASPAPEPSQSEVAGPRILDPVTPRLLPLSSATLPSTTPQISPLATKDNFAAQANDGHVEDVENRSRDAEVPDSHVEEEVDAPVPAVLAKNGHSGEDQPALIESESAAEHVARVTATAEVVSDEIEGMDPPGPWRSDDLAEKDAFSDEEPDEAMSSHELDGEIIYEDDAEDVFDADTLEGGEPSDDDTNEDFEMHQLPGEGQQWPEESTTEKDSDLEDQPMLEAQMDSDVATQSQASVNEPRVSQQPGFAPASTLLRAAETPARNTVSAAAVETPSMATPFKQPSFTVEDALPSTEVATPAAKSSDTPKRTPQSAHDRVMKRTFHSLFGIKGTTSPEKEDVVKRSDELIDEGDKVSKFDLLANKPDALEVDQIQDRPDVDEDGDQSTHSAVSQVDINVPDQAGLHDESHTLESSQPPLAVKEVFGQLEEDRFAVASQEVPLAPEQQITELINLDSDSDEEPSTEEIAVDQVTEEPVVSESSPRNQALERTNDLVSSALEENDDTEPDTTPTQDGSVDVVMPEAVLADAVEASSVPDVTEQRHTLSDDPSEQGIFKSGDVDMLQEQEPSGVPDPELDTVTPDSFERTVSPPLALSPRLEGKDVSPIELEHDDQTKPKPVQISDDGSEDVVEPASNADLQMDDGETPLVIPDSLQPSAPLDGQDARSPSVVSEKTITEVDDEETGVVDVDDVDMLDVHQRERESPQASFESQVVQDSVQQREGESPEASFESQVAPDGLDANGIGVHESSSRPVKRDTVEDFSPVVLNARQREAEPSQASFESQVVRDSMDVHKDGVHEISSRPTSRDTVEDFSPVALGTFSQRISDVVSESQGAERLRELGSDGQNMLDQVPLDLPEGPATSLSNSETLALMDQDVNTPSRAAKHTATAIELEPTPSHEVDYKHVKTDQSTREQMLTPRATVDDKKEEDIGMADSTETMQQRSAELREDLSESDMRALRRPSYAALDGTSEIDDVQAKVTESADLTLPISPSATQSQQAEPEAQLSHVNTAQAVMQPAPLTLTSQVESSAQLLADAHALEAQDQTPNMSRIQQQQQEQEMEQEQANMPPPEQPLPPKTPGRKSLRSRLSNVPDVISAWFSPKRSTLALQESEKPTEVEKTKRSAAETISDAPTPKKHASGLSTAHAYFTSLASLDQHLNHSSQQTSAIDLLAVVTDFAKEPERAKGGPRDYYTVCKITDPSMPDSSPVRVEVFRPWKAVLPAADVGDVILLRGFVVKSKKRQAYLLSTDTSAWCVWRFAEHSNDNSRAVGNEAGKPAWARRMSHGEVREEVKGPPVEYGLAEKHEARKLRDWWNEMHDDSQGGASDTIVGTELSEEPDTVES